MLYVFLVIEHSRRKILHFNVTSHPTQEWAIGQIREAFPYDTQPGYLIRDNDSIYGEQFRNYVAHVMKIQDTPTSFRSPWQNGYCERVIGSIRRECLDHFVVLGEDHLRLIVRSYVEYYNAYRPHQSLRSSPPEPTPRKYVSTQGRTVSRPMVMGLHHHYSKAA